MKKKFTGHLLVLLFTFTLAVAACNTSIPRQVTGTAKPVTAISQTTPAASPSPTLLPSPSITPSPTDTSTAIPADTATAAPSHTPAPSPTITLTSTPIQSATPSLTPTYAILRGTVLEQANCRYGPGAAYLYKYGLYPGNNIEITGRNETGSWIVIQAIGGTNPCWVKASLLDIKGDVMSLAPTSLPLPHSPFYGPLTGVYAERKGNDVIISWDAMILRAGDDSLQFPYLIEAWLCQDGQLSFYPIGSWETILTVQDEPGCAEASHARIYGVEKHGYTNWVTIPWPAP